MFKSHELVDEGPPELVTFPMVADGRCFFRSISEWLEDPLRNHAYYQNGKHADPGAAAQETMKADNLRQEVVSFAVRTGISDLAEPDAETWERELRALQAWADQVAIAATPFFGATHHGSVVEPSAQEAAPHHLLGTRSYYCNELLVPKGWMVPNLKNDTLPVERFVDSQKLELMIIHVVLFCAPPR